MPIYQAPVRDINFVMNELWDISSLFKDLPAYQGIDNDLIDTVLTEAAKFVEKELFPLNQSGDAEGCHFNNGKVTTPKGFKEAYQHMVAGGWMSLNSDPEFGGQGLPKMLQVALDEMLCGSNVAFSLYTVLTQGAVHALHGFASQEIKDKYLPKMTSGEWSGTMCLTESHCGTDLGLLRTKAEPTNDGSFKISGTKIFITSGEHDLTDNIIHTVLARLPNAPEGVKGISLFLVPKYLVNADGSLGALNSVSCGAIEHKMGIKGSATCVINFEGAIGYLIGKENEGLKAMFSMMNLERLNIGLEGLGLADAAQQNAIAYAKERLQGRAARGPACKDKPADPIMVHPDVRRMLLTMKAFTEGARALALWTAKQIDIAKHHPDKQEQSKADDLVALMTPVIKAFFTDYGFNCCNLAVQVFGGHGYIRETGIEQYVRDARIAQIYEGANGVQALDLIKRKLLANKGAYIELWQQMVNEFIAGEKNNAAIQEFIKPLTGALADLTEVSHWIINASEKNPDEVGAASVDYLHLLGLVGLAYMWAYTAKVAQEKLGSASDKDFYQAKLYTARFFMQRMLPAVSGLKQMIMAGSASMMDMPEGMF